MAALVPQSSSLNKFETTDVPDPAELPPFMVLDLNRYYPEPSFRNLLGIDTCHFWDVFDITLSDGVHKMKFVLTADARLKKKVIPGCFVRLKKFARHWNEQSIEREAVVVIQELDVVNEQPVKISTGDHDRLPWTGTCTSKQKENVPLASARSYYMDNWSFNIAAKSLEYEVQNCKVCSIDMAEVKSIRDIATKKISQFAKPALLVKVMRKSKLIHYVAHSKEDKWPVQLPLMVADHTGWCAVVLWNKLGLQVLNQVHEGSLLFLRNFRVKTSFQQKGKSFFPPPEGTRLYPCELSLDIHHPTTEVKLVTFDSDDHIERLQFPILESCHMTRRDLISVPDLSTVDVGGLITFVGRVEREPRKGSGSLQHDSGAFFYRRWVHLRDTSLSDPIIALVYSGEQIDTFLSLKPGQHLLCRHMLTIQRLDDLICSRQKRYGMLTTTTYSRLYVFSPKNTDNLPESLKDIVKPCMPEHPSDYKDLFREGGFFRYPPFPCNLESLKKSKSEVLEMIIPSNQWRAVFNRMSWRECHQLAVHASFLSATFTKVTKEEPRELRCSRRKQIRLSPTTLTANVSHDSAGIDGDHLGSILTEDISELWPLISTGSDSNPKPAMLMEWQGLNDPVILNTIKPCAFNTNNKINSFSHLVSGEHDSYLGLIDSVRSQLSREEIKDVTNSAKLLVNHKFFLLLDVYTNSDCRQLVVLNRAILT